VTALKNIFKDIYRLAASNIPLVIITVATLLLSFGYVLAHSTIGTDDTALDRYADGTELLAQGRFTIPLLQRLFGIFDYAPWWTECLAVCGLLLGILSWCLLLQRASNDQLKQRSYFAFAVIFGSYPLINEIFIYSTACLAVTILYTAVAVDLLLMLEYTRERKHRSIIIAIVILVMVISTYESFAVVYLAGVVCLLILQYLYTENRSNLLQLMRSFSVMLLPLLVAVILEKLIADSIVLVMGLEKSLNSASSVVWLTGSLTETLANIVSRIALYYFAAGISYLPILIYALTVFLALGMGMAYWLKKRSSTLFLLLTALICSTWSLTFIQGIVTPYRACQVFTLFTAFVLMLAVQFYANRRIVGNIVTVAVMLIALLQSRDLNQWFYFDYLKYQQDVCIMQQVAYELAKNHDLQKPVIFVGSPAIADNILAHSSFQKNSFVKTAAGYAAGLLPDRYQRLASQVIEKRYNQSTATGLFMSWGVCAFDEVNTELLKFFKMHGYNFRKGNIRQYNEAIRTALFLPVWPKSGSIIDSGEYIIINFGQKKEQNCSISMN